MTQPLQPGHNEAESRIREHLDAVRGALEGAGVPARQVGGILDDIRAQIDAVAGTGADATLAGVEAAIAGMDTPGQYAEAFRGEPANPGLPDGQGIAPMISVPNPPGPPMTGRGQFWVLLFGILGPAGVLGFEFLSRFCATNLFDPIPTWSHIVLVALVPVANLLTLAAVRSGRLSHPRLLLFLNGAALSVGFVYSLVFLPLVPIALIALLGGIGFLPLSPFFAFAATLACRAGLKRAWAAGREPGGEPANPGFPAHVVWGASAAFLLLVLANLPMVVTRWGMSLAAGEDPAGRQRGIGLLRTAGSEEEILRACYRNRRGGDGMGPLAWVLPKPPGMDAARTVYYRVTGRPYNSVPLPQSIGWGNWGRFDWTEVDPENRDEAVGSRDRRLSLAGSRLDGIVDAPSGTGYLEWTLTFRNSNTFAREARAIVALPPGGVVSRLTLWVNGEEREAAFARRSHVKKAYEDVVTRTPNRDPVLVTTAGNDRVMLRCFPVPAGGTLKTRIGITLPVNPPVHGYQARLRLPGFLDRNFVIPADTPAPVWIETGANPWVNEATGLAASTDRTRIEGSLRPRLMDEQTTITLGTPPDAGPRTYAGGAGATSATVRQELVERRTPRPQRVVLVLDGSRALASLAGDLARCVHALPRGIQVAAVVSDDSGARELLPLTRLDADAAARLEDAVRTHRFVGGMDNVPALVRGWELAGDSPAAIVIWVHGPQPVVMQPPDALVQRSERATTWPRMLEMQVSPGPDSVLPDWGRVCKVGSVPRDGDPAGDLTTFLRSLDGNTTGLEWKRERVSEAAGPVVAGKTAGHVVRLWANDEVHRLALRPSASQEDKAVQLAAATQLVTPVTGAVVLETREMFDAAGLKPVDPSSVPTIPEPETWALLAVVGAVLAWTLAGRRRTENRGA